MSKPGADPSSGTSLGDALRLPKRHPACRRREAQSGSCMERENLAGDAKGKGASGSNREAESTDAPERGGLPCSSDEAGVMLVERRGRVTDVGSGQPATTTGDGRSPKFNGRRQPSLDGTSRISREAQVRFCEGLGVKFPGPTRHSLRIDANAMSAEPLIAYNCCCAANRRVGPAPEVEPPARPSRFSAWSTAGRPALRALPM